jgi:hypothetical protein
MVVLKALILQKKQNCFRGHFVGMLFFIICHPGVPGLGYMPPASSFGAMRMQTAMYGGQSFA